MVSFPKGISGVVGPNGCGKSNIVDAIKWVMGEQSPKQLRGKGMEDVIFAGSNGKSSVGMAEVSLVLDNDNGSIPKEYAEYSEVVITRRLFRDGESEYAINNKPCRLKDISLLFMDTGVGSKAYSVIEQGRIGAIIDSKPEDRRHWIEEAAGISRYKSQKNETLRKLDLTQQNLLRVSDVIAEVKRQMNSLYRQAKKAERFKEIRKQSKEIELVLLVKEYQTWSEEKAREEEKLLNQQTRTGELREECQSQEAALDHLQGDLSALEKRLKDKQEQFYRQKGDLEKQENLREQYGNALRALEKEALDLEKELQEIRKWLEENDCKEKQLAEEVRTFSQTLAEEETQVREGEHRVEKAKKALTESQGEVERIKDLLVTKLTEQTGVKNQRSGLIKQREDRQRRLVRQLEEKGQLVSRLDFLQTSAEEIHSLLNKGKEALEAVKEQSESTRRQKGELDLTRKKTEEELRDLEHHFKQDQSQIRNLQTLLESRQSYENGVRAL
ncbi:MAG: chromosome segregation protein SMC, partial [Thermodesulfobacteriota bacterium]